jgi:predicted TIM-barrel fold metal-dependent hydrolase
VYFDFSGGTTIERHAVERRLIGHEIGCEKLIFGSDTAPEKIAEHIRRWDTIFDLLDIAEDERDRMWWLNGAEVYGLVKAPWATPPKAKPAPIRVSVNGATARAKPRARAKR